MSKLAAGWGSRSLPGVFLLALLVIGIGLAAGCGNEGSPSVNGTGIPTGFTVMANLTTAAGPVAANTSATLSGASATGTFAPLFSTVGANGLVQFNNVPSGSYVITTSGGSSGPITVLQTAVSLGVVRLSAAGSTTGGNTGTGATGSTGSSNTTGLTTDSPFGATNGMTTSGTVGTTTVTVGTTSVTVGTATGNTAATTGNGVVPASTTTGTGVVPASTTTGTPAKVPPGGPFVVSGQLVSSDGSMVGNLPINVRSLNGWVDYTVTSGPTGAFSIGQLSPEPYVLLPAGFNPILINGSSVKMNNLGTLEVVPAIPMTSSIVGKLIDQNNNDLTGFTVTGNGLTSTSVTNGSVFVVSGLPHGISTLTFTGGGIQSSQSIQVENFGSIVVFIGGIRVSTLQGTGSTGTGSLGSGG